MFNLFKKEPTLEFFSLIPEVTQVAPIVHASTYKPDWFIKAQQEFVEATKDQDFGKHKSIHTAKCPGVFNLIRYGWVMTTYQDIVIKTNGDGESFEWRTPVNQATLNNNGVIDAVGFHAKEQLAVYQGGWKDSLNSVIKINTPWRCIVPKGYYLYENHLPYSEEKRFTTLPGFYSQEYGVSQLNVQLQWHILDDEVLIKAGTPIAHYMLIPKHEARLMVSDASPEQLAAEKVTQLEISKRYVSDKAKSKCVFARMFK